VLDYLTIEGIEMEEKDAQLEIENFINGLLDKSNKQIDIIKLIKIDISHFSRVLFYYRNLDNKYKEPFTSKISFCLDYYTSYLITNKNNYSNALNLLNVFDVDLRTLWNRDKFRNFYIHLTIKHIICLIKSSLLEAAIFKSFEISSIYKSVKKQSKIVNSDIEKFKTISFNLIQIRNVLLLMGNECKKNNYHNDRSRLKTITKKLELQIYKLKIDYNFDDKILIQPNFSYTGGLIPTIILNSNRFNTKGFKKLKYILFNYIKIILNNFDNCFWGYRESIPKIVRSSFLVILIYTILMQVGLVKVVNPQNSDNVTGFFNYLYFSIVTFTSLGYGDIAPFPKGCSRLIMSSEAIVGLICISLIIFVISRKR